MVPRHDHKEELVDMREVLLGIVHQVSEGLQNIPEQLEKIINGYNQFNKNIVSMQAKLMMLKNDGHDVQEDQALLKQMKNVMDTNISSILANTKDLKNLEAAQKELNGLSEKIENTRPKR